PGYWPTHDADRDGIACEPWRGGSAGGVRVHRYWSTGRR
ncbi:MAG: calcium-binding protein, partial [Mesorhizobium sp.]